MNECFQGRASTRRLRALIVGSGYRVQHAFLPALQCLSSHIDIVGVYSRTLAHARNTAQRFGVDVIDDPRQLQPGDIDIALVSVTVTNNIAALKTIEHLAPGSALVIDTPVLGRLDDLARLAHYRRWAHIRIAEDFMVMPQFRLIAALANSGALGDITAMSLQQMGYRYHALALLRSWVGFRSPRWIRSRRINGGANIVYRFPDGIRGNVYEPYHQGQGYFSIAGRDGQIIGHPLGHELTPNYAGTSGGAQLNDQCGVLVRIENHSGLVGFGVEGLQTPIQETKTPTQETAPHLATLRTLGLDNDSEFNLLRIDGLCTVISSLWNTELPVSRYGLHDAMADHTTSLAARYLPLLALR